MRDAYDLKAGNGGIVLNDGDSWTMATTGPLANKPTQWVSIKNDTVLASYTGNLTDGDSKLTGPTLPAGSFIEGQTTFLEVTTGLLVLSF